MRPTVTEQLQGVSRVLEDAIVPALDSSFANETLRSLISNIRMLSKSWHQVLPFLHWDNTETLLLLSAARPLIQPDVARRIDELMQQQPTDPLDCEALEMHNIKLRDLLVTVLKGLSATTIDDPASIQKRITEHLEARAKRYPMRLSGATPTHNQQTVQS